MSQAPTTPRKTTPEDEITQEIDMADVMLELSEHSHDTPTAAQSSHAQDELAKLLAQCESEETKERFASRVGKLRKDITHFGGK